MFNKKGSLGKTITIVSIIGILIFMAIFGIQQNNKNIGETQISATEMMWETSQAGDYNKSDTITITLKGVDTSGIQNSSLQPSDITVYLDGKEVNPTTKTVTAVQTKGDYASYTLTLSGFKDTGHLYFKIKDKTLTDKVGKTSSELYVGTGINIIPQKGKLEPIDYVSSGEWSSDSSAEKAFDGIGTTYWHAPRGLSWPQYCGAKFASNVHVEYFTLTFHWQQYEIVLQGSDDGVTWTDIQTFSCSNGTDTYRVTNTYSNTYNYYAVKSTSGENYVSYHELTFYGYEE